MRTGSKFDLKLVLEEIPGSRVFIALVWVI